MSHLSCTQGTQSQLNWLGSGGALGGDVLHEAEPWGLGFPWGDANVTGQLACFD